MAESKYTGEFKIELPVIRQYLYNHMYFEPVSHISLSLSVTIKTIPTSYIVLL